MTHEGFDCAPDDPDWLRELDRGAARAGLAVRGAFHPSIGEFEQLPAAAHSGTVVLLGFTADLQWPVFAQSAEACDGRPHPLDRWSRRVIAALARDFGALDISPADVPVIPFQQLAMRCESVYPSPIGLLIHPRWGLWHAYRGGLIFPERLVLSRREASPSPCVSCAGKPCLTHCPVGAFSAEGYDLHACLEQVSSVAGAQCRQGGCLARHACPIGAPANYSAGQHRFHMNAFLAAFKARERSDSDSVPGHHPRK